MLKSFHNTRSALLYILPALLLILTFLFVPIIFNLYYSFYSWSAFQMDGIFVGLAYYKKLIQDPVFYIALKNNALFAIISLIVQVGIGLVIAAILEDGVCQHSCRISLFLQINNPNPRNISSNALRLFSC